MWPDKLGRSYTKIDRMRSGYVDNHVRTTTVRGYRTRDPRPHEALYERLNATTKCRCHGSLIPSHTSPILRSRCWASIGCIYLSPFPSDPAIIQVLIVNLSSVYDSSVQSNRIVCNIHWKHIHSMRSFHKKPIGDSRTAGLKET